MLSVTVKPWVRKQWRLSHSHLESFCVKLKSPQHRVSAQTLIYLIKTLFHSLIIIVNNSSFFRHKPDEIKSCYHV